jgi:2'-5' RNA ligase
LINQQPKDTIEVTKKKTERSSMTRKQHVTEKTSLRTFIAIPLPESVKTWMGQMQKRLRHHAIKASWTSQDTMHLTVIFTGQIYTDQVQSFTQCMEKAASQCSHFSLQGSGLGVFPTIKRPRVLWGGLRGQTDQLKHLYTCLETQISKKMDVPMSQKRFSAHLTLARIKQPVPTKKMVCVLQEFESCVSEESQVSRIDLFKSHLMSSGARHTRLYSARLKSQRS